MPIATDTILLRTSLFGNKYISAKCQSPLQAITTPDSTTRSMKKCFGGFSEILFFLWKKSIDRI